MPIRRSRWRWDHRQRRDAGRCSPRCGGRGNPNAGGAGSPRDPGASPTADRRTIAIDLRNDWPKALNDNGFDPTQPSAWIAEGLLIYLPPEAQDLLFDRINELSAPGSRVATEHIPDMTMFSDERSEQITARLKKYGSDIEMRDLFEREGKTPDGDLLAKCAANLLRMWCQD